MLIVSLQVVTQREIHKKNITFRMKNTKKKLKGQSRVVKYSFNQVDVASSLSKTQASLFLHSFIATFTGNNITKYSGLNTVEKYMNKQGIVKSISTYTILSFNNKQWFNQHLYKFYRHTVY
jgi:hypothetical protein